MKLHKVKELNSFETRKLYYFKLRLFSFNSYVYYLTHGYVTSACAFNLLTFNLATRDFSLLTRGSELVNRGLELATRNLDS